MRLRQFRFHEPLKTILNQNKTCRKWASFACFVFAVKHAKLAHFLHVSFWFRIVLRGSWKRNCRSLTLFRLVLLILASLEFCFACFSFSFGLFRIFFVSQNLETLLDYSSETNKNVAWKLCCPAKKSARGLKIC
jgi:hypothetical protein